MSRPLSRGARRLRALGPAALALSSLVLWAGCGSDDSSPTSNGGGGGGGGGPEIPDVLFQFVADDLTLARAGGLVDAATANPANQYVYDGGWSFESPAPTAPAPLVESWEGRHEGNVATWVETADRPVFLDDVVGGTRAAVGFMSVDLPNIDDADGWTATTQDPGPRESQMTFDATGLVGTDYTIMAVMRLDRNMEVRHWGTEPGNSDPASKLRTFPNTVRGPLHAIDFSFVPGNNLQFGLLKDRGVDADPNVWIAHSGRFPEEAESFGLLSPTPAASGVFQIITVVHTQPTDTEDGTFTIYVGDQQIGTGAIEQGLIGFANALLGSYLGAPFVGASSYLLLAELRSYAEALDQEQLEAVVAELNAFYGL
jgi:hypothetical protein